MIAFSGALGKPEIYRRERATEMASKKVVVPLKGTWVKKGVNYVKTADGKVRPFTTITRVDSPVDVDYLRHGGVLNMVLRNVAKA